MMKTEQKTPRIRFKGFTDDWPACRQAGNSALRNGWCVYVLECDDGSLYKGKTNEINRRLQEHLSGNGAKHTKRHNPIRLVYLEYFHTEKEALAEEKYLKSGSGREWLKRYVKGE